MTSPTLARPGAVPATGADAGVAWHYGDPVAEQRAIEDGRAVADQSHLGIVTVSGPERLTWLNSLCSQETATLAPGVSTEVMILSPQGRIELVAGAIDDGTTAWLISETARALAEHLTRMRFMVEVEVADVGDQWAAIGSTSADPAGELTWNDPWPGIAAGGTSYSGTSHPAENRAWYLTLVPRSDVDARLDARVAAGATLVGAWATEATRIAARRPRAILDADVNALPHELDWLRTAVHLDKGCYRGQETVAKVHNVGRPPRRLTLLHLDGSEHELPDVGAEVKADGKVVGTLTSVARHHELGPIGLGLIKRITAADAALTVTSDGAEVAASQEIIVDPAGESIDRPAAPGPTARGLLMGKGCAADGGDLDG